MDEIRKEFLNSLGELISLINFYNTESKLLQKFENQGNSKEEILINELATQLNTFSLSKRRYNYSSIVISLYGYFESFIEDLIISYVDVLNDLVENYSDLEAGITNSHLNQSLALLSKVTHAKYSGLLKKEDIINNLHSCLNLDKNYTLNRESFSLHTANFRYAVVDELFGHIGIQAVNSQVLKHETFRQKLDILLNKDESDSITIEEGFYYMNDLAERRNEIAHGIPDNILTNTLLKDYISFFESYSVSLCEIISIHKLHLEIKHIGKQIGKVTGVYKNGRVVCAFSNNTYIAKGDYIIGKNKSSIKKAKIIGLVLDENPIDHIPCSKNVDIGLELDNSFSDSHIFYCISNLD